MKYIYDKSNLIDENAYYTLKRENDTFIDLFIENGANLDLKDKDGKTVLDYADKKIKSAINWSLNKKKWNSFKRGFGLGD